MKLIISLSILMFSTIALSLELNDLYYFPNKGDGSFSLSTQYRRYNIEYEDDALPDGKEDVLEFEKQVINLLPEVKYALSNKLVVEASVTWQMFVYDSHLETEDDKEIEKKEDTGLFDPTLSFRYRLKKKDVVYIDTELKGVYKTNGYVEPSFQRNGQAFSGSSMIRLTTFMGIDFHKFLLQSYFNIDYLYGIEKQLALFRESYTADDTYAVGFGGEVLFEIGKYTNLSFGGGVGSVDSYKMTNVNGEKITIDQAIQRNATLSIDYKKWQKQIGILSFNVFQRFDLDRLTYDENTQLNSDNTFTIFP